MTVETPITGRNSESARPAVLPAVALAVAGVATAVACGPSDEDPSAAAPAFEQWDSASVQITESSGEALAVVLPWVLDTVPELEIGTVAGDEAYQFTSVSSVTSGPGGEIVVLDEGSLNLRWFDSSGTFLRAVGGSGGGPGEFTRVQMVPQFQPDSLLVYDFLQRRFTSIAPDGEWIRTQTRDEAVQSHFATGRPVVADGASVLFQGAAGTCPSGSDGVCSEPVFIHALDPGAGTSDTVAVATRRFFRISESGALPMILTIPFDPEVSAAADARGVLLTTGEEFEIRGFGRYGELERILRIDHPPPALEEDELEPTIRAFPPGKFEQMEVRETKPAFRALRVDALGWTWAKRYRVDEELPAEWVVFDPSGRAQGVMSVPSGLQVHDIGEDFLLGVAVDTLGVQYVRRHYLDRGGS